MRELSNCSRDNEEHNVSEKDKKKWTWIKHSAGMVNYWDGSSSFCIRVPNASCGMETENLFRLISDERRRDVTSLIARKRR